MRKRILAISEMKRNKGDTAVVTVTKRTNKQTNKQS